MIRIAYLCDRKKCEECRKHCKYTTDIAHAVNFEEVENGKYIERPEEKEEEKDDKEIICAG